MANKKITQLPAAASVTADQIIAIVNDPTGTPVTQRATIQQLLDLIAAASQQVFGGAGEPGALVPTASFAIWINTNDDTLRNWHSGSWH